MKQTRIASRPQPAALRLLGAAAAAFALLALPSQAAAEPAPVDAAKLAPAVFHGQGGNVAPYKLFLGTPANWAFTIPDNGQGAMDAGNIKAEPARIGDQAAVKVTWTGGIGQVYSQSKMVSDRFDYIEAESALIVDAVIHKAPEDQVVMRVDCRYPCMGVVDVTEHLRKLPLEQPVAIKIPLSCFEKTGAKFAVVNTPWLFFSAKPFSLTLANPRYVPGAAKDPDAFKC